MAGIGPGPFCAMLLGDLGADVIRVDRPPGSAGNLPEALLQISGRNRRSVAVDLKKIAGVAVVMDLVATADVLTEGYRPGVMERLGLGPEVCLGRNEGLVYGRMTGWGQDGPMASMAGHDINYIGLAGALAAIGTPERPILPLNPVGDYGGGALYLALGVLAALVERQASGHGQVVDAAMVDGAASLMAPMYQMRSVGVWESERETNLLDGGAPFYRPYRTSDNRWMAVGALEPQFYAALLDGLGLVADDVPPQLERSGWPMLEERFAVIFVTRTQSEWTATFAGTDACVTPVLDMDEAPRHEHNVARGTFIDVQGAGAEPGPAPRFDRTAAATPVPPVAPGEHTTHILTELGYDVARQASLREQGVIA